MDVEMLHIAPLIYLYNTFRSVYCCLQTVGQLFNEYSSNEVKHDWLASGHTLSSRSTCECEYC